MYMLAAFRAFQGLGAGGLFSLAIAIIADIVSPQQRPRYLGYMMSTFASASVLGPVVGGLLSGQASILGITGWRWIFYVNVPIGIVALIVVNRVARLPTKRRARRESTGGARPSWPSGWCRCWSSPNRGRRGAGASPAAFAVLPRRRRRPRAVRLGRAPDGRRTRCCRCGCSASGPSASARLSRRSSASGMFGGLSAIPLYLQIVKGASPTEPACCCCRWSAA